MSSVLLNLITYSYNGRFIVRFEDDISETCCVEVFTNLLGDKIVDTLLGNSIGKYRILFVIF